MKIAEDICEESKPMFDNLNKEGHYSLELSMEMLMKEISKDLFILKACYIVSNSSPPFSRKFRLAPLKDRGT